jgi:HlyD family secretion protein
MDILRPNAARDRRRRLLIKVGVGVLVLVVASVAVSRLKPAAPSVDRAQVWTDAVKRGEMVRQVRGNGTLLPEEIRWIPTFNQGRVERIMVLPGAEVKAETVLVELSNPEVTQAAFDAEWQLKASEAELANLVVQLETQRLNQEAGVATAQANFNNASLDAEVNTELAKDGLVPALVLKQSTNKAMELSKLLTIEQERLRIRGESARAQLAVQQARVEQLRAQLELKRRHSDALRIRAGIDGVLQKLGDTAMLQVGQQLGPGANVARVAIPTRLKAEIKIPETQAKDIVVGQKTIVDTRNGKVEGRVARIDPAVQNGTVTVDATLEGPLPKGARPDLSVDGTIELERLADVLHVGRPVQVDAESKVTLFKLVDGGRGAIRVPVRLGRSSVETIEVREGLQVGDQVILSDMSQYDGHDRIRLN